MNSDEDTRDRATWHGRGSLPSLTPTRTAKEMETVSFSKDIDDSPSWQSKFLAGNQTRTDVGTCLIVFGLPLLIPGVTLTAVAFDDETGFSQFSVLHIIGIVMLSMAVIFIIVGVALVIKIGYKVVPEYPMDSPQISSTHDRVQTPPGIFQKSNVKYDSDGKRDIIKTPSELSPSTIITTATVLSGENNATYVPPGDIPPSKTPLNFMIELGQGHECEPQSLPQKSSTVGSLPPISDIRTQTVPCDGYVSSTDYEEDSDDLDSDEHSSGSYIISGENAVFHQSNEDIFKNKSTPETSVISVPGPCKRSYTPRSRLSLNLPQSRNFFYNKDNNSTVSENRKIKYLKGAKQDQYSTSSVDASDTSTNDNIMIQKVTHECQMKSQSDNSIDDKMQEPNIKVSPKIALVSPSPLGSPRHRLEAFSNTSALASSMQMRNSEELLPENIAGDMSESNGSVFTGEEVDAVIENVRDTKCCSADDVTHSRPSSSSFRTFTYDFTLTSDSQKSTEASGVTDATGSATKDDHQNKEEYTSSPTLVTILQSKSVYDTVPPGDDSTHCADGDGRLSASQQNSNTVTSAIFSPPSHIFNYMGNTANANNSRRRVNVEPVPLKAKKRAKFHSEGDECAVNVTFFEYSNDHAVDDAGNDNSCA